MAATDFERLNIVLAARDREFQRGMDRAIKRVERFERQSNRSLSKTSRHFNKTTVAVRALLPALTALGTIASVRNVVADLDQLAKTADKLGLTTDTLQEYRAAAESAGVSQQTLDMAIQRFGRRLAEARQGTGEAVGVLREMDIALVDAFGNARPMEDVLSDIADEMSGMAEQTDRNRIAMKLFDSEGVALVNMLGDGSAALAEMRKEARETGAVIDESLVREAEAAQTRIDQMSRVIRAQLSTALVQLAPVLEAGATGLANIVTRGMEARATLAHMLDGQEVQAARQFETAIDNVTLALGDEIRQSQLSRAALQEQNTLTLRAAQVKLQEAQGRRANILAMMEETRQQLMGSEEYIRTLERIRRARETVNVFTPPGADIEDVPAHLREAYIAAEERLRSALELQAQMLADLDAGFADAQTEISELDGLIARLDDGIANAVDGVVDLGDGLVVPVELGERLRDTLGGVSLAGAVNQASELARQLGIAVSSASRIAYFGQVNESTVSGFEPSDPRSGRPGPVWTGGYSRSVQNTAGLRFSSRGGGGGGGGGLSEAQRRENELIAEGQRLIERLRTEAERYADEKERLNELMQAGAIDTETYDRALADLQERYGEVGDAAQRLERMSEDLFVSILSGASSAKDAVADLLQQLSAMALRSAFSGLFGGLFNGVAPLFGGSPAIGAAAFPSAGALPLQQPGALPAPAPARMGGGGVVLNYAPVIDARGADQAAVDRIEAQQEQQARTFNARVVAAVRTGKHRRLI